MLEGSEAGGSGLEAKGVCEEPGVSGGVCRRCCRCGSEAPVLHAVRRGARVHTACLHPSIAVTGRCTEWTQGWGPGGAARSDGVHVFARVYCILLLRLLFFFTLAREKKKKTKKKSKEEVSLVVFKVGCGEPRGVPRENSRGPQQNNGPIIFI